MQSFQKLLTRTLEERKARNPLYSLRSFARQLDLSPALLSLLINGKQELSPKAAGKIATHLSLSPRECRDYLGIQTGGGGGAPTKKQRNKFMEVSADDFALIADWYHYGILALAQLENNAVDMKWIASRLGISKREATLGYNRLKNLGYIVETGNGFRQTSTSLTTSTDVPSSAIRKHHRQNLLHAEETLDGVHVNERFFSSFTTAIALEDYEFVSDEIAKFQRKLAAKLKKRVKKNAVYTFSAQFFPRLNLQ